MNAEEYRRAQADAMTEAQLLAALLGTPRRPGLADALGWRGYHTHRSDRSPAGFPDLCLVHPTAGRLVFAELKRQRRSNPTPAQRDWLTDLEAVARGIADEDRLGVYLWRPLDLLDGTIEAILRAPR